VPIQFIIDNNKWFETEKSKEMCEGLKLEIKFASVVHLQTNGAVKRDERQNPSSTKEKTKGGARG
jgi:hypothetical protein